MTELPPWEPIADWLCRLEDSDHGNATQREIRRHHETEAKAIAYDIATHTEEKAEELHNNIINENPVVGRVDP